MLNNEQSRWSLAAGALFLVLFLAAMFRTDLVSIEGAVYEEACKLILAKTSEGRQALVSSAWWPPLNTLLRLPFALLTGVNVAPVASAAVAALFGVATLLLLVRMCAAAGQSRVGLVAVATLLLNPFYIEQSINGSAATTAAFFALLAAHGLAEWLATRRLAGLIYLGTGCALLSIASFDLTPVAIAALLLFLADLAASNLPTDRKISSALLVLLPIGYTLALWILMNWLIMGDGLYFLRGLVAAAQAHGAPQPAPHHSTTLRAIPPAFIATAIGCAAFALVGLLNNGKQALCLGLLGLVLFTTGAIGRTLWPEIDSSRTLFALLPIATAAAATTATRCSSSRQAWLTAITPLLLAGLICHDPSLMERWKSGSPASDRIATERLFIRPRIEQHVLRQSRYPRVFVCGYDGLLLARPPAALPLIHSLDLDFQQIVTDFRGCNLYILVRKPTPGLYGADSVHWKFPGIYPSGRTALLFDSQWDDWRLFELIQAPLKTY